MSHENVFFIKESTMSRMASSARKILESDIKLSTEDIVLILNNLIKRDIVFISSKASFNIAMRGTGDVKIYINSSLYETVSLNPNQKNTLALSTEGERAIFSLEGANGIIELDLRESGLEDLVFNSYVPLNKLIIFNNNIKRLDLSRCKELQFLHFHNNPICDEDKYKEELVKCINSLPDRSHNTIGSILLYPWYGLETLICKDDSGAWKKYPIEQWTDADGKTKKSTYSSSLNLDKIEGKLFGEVDGDNITYHLYKNGRFEPYIKMNRHHCLRKNLEKTTLPKNWMFGSAIQYSDEYKYCHYHFKEIGVQHVWETAEKGFGMKIGTIDTIFGNQAMNMNEMNVIASLTLKGQENNLNPQKDTGHGNFILSQLVGRGNEITYGLCPNASIFMIGAIYNSTSGDDSTTASWWKKSLLRLTNNCNSLTFSYTAGWNYDDWHASRVYLGEFGEYNIVTESAGNNGDNRPWTGENNKRLYYGFGNFGKIQDGKVTDPFTNHTNTFFVSSITPIKKPSTFSQSTTNSSFGEGEEKVNNIPSQDFLSSYGDHILGYDSTKGRLARKQGTSMASPNCNGTLALMRVIYSKINPNCKKFGKGSEFMDYVFTHWLDPIEGQMDFSIGIGVPIFLAKPTDRKLPLNKEYNKILHTQAKVGNKLKFFKQIEYPESKDGYTYDFNHNYFAQIDSNTLIPLKQSADYDGIVAYSNSSLQNPIDHSENYSKLWVNLGEIEPTDEVYELVNGSLSSYHSKKNDENCFCVDSDSKEYTIQLKVIFSIDKMFDKDITEGTGTTIFAKLEYADFFSFLGLTSSVITDEKGRHFDSKYKSELGYNRPELIQNKTESYDIAAKVSLDLYDRLQLLQDGNSGVFTIACNETGLLIYYNGTLLNKIDPGPIGFETLRDWVILADTLESNSKNNVIFYDRCLSQSEIINNTIYLLNKEG